MGCVYVVMVAVGLLVTVRKMAELAALMKAGNAWCPLLLYHEMKVVTLFSNTDEKPPNL
jgi:uncharacterized membrane protein YdjX (TVP38/TMEM64 family)